MAKYCAITDLHQSLRQPDLLITRSDEYKLRLIEIVHTLRDICAAQSYKWQSAIGFHALGSSRMSAPHVFSIMTM